MNKTNQKHRHLPLYLKYRPQSLSDLVGQDTVVKILSNALANNRLSHAYLFIGPRGVGKTSSARILAKSVNCESGPTAVPCKTCIPCVEITEGISPSVFEIDAASNNSVDDARVLIERAPLVSVSGRYKLYIIDECHMLTKEAFNALLKTLEEPPANVIFILATTEEHKVPATIVSRCQRLIFHLAPQNALSEHLRAIANKENIAIEDSALNLIARHSGGGLRDALGLLDQASLLSSQENKVSVSDLLQLLGAVEEDSLLEISQHIYEKQGQLVLSAINKHLASGREPTLIALELAKHFLNLTKAAYILESQTETKQAQSSTSSVLGSPDYLSGLYKQAALFTKIELIQIVSELDKLELACRRSSQPVLNLEAGLLSICHRNDINLIKRLEERIQILEKATPIQNKAPEIVSEIKNTNDLELKLESTPAQNSPQNDFSITALSAEKEIEDQSPSFDLEQFWEQLLNGVQKTSIPAYSVLSEHAFPLAVTKSEFTIGVMNDQFKTHVERRLDRIKNTCEEILGRSVVLKVKISTKEEPKSDKKPSVKETKNLPAANFDLVDSFTEQNDTTSIKETAAPKDDEPKVVSGKAANSVFNAKEADSHTGAVQDAYSLFEGPGSRLII